MREIIVHHSFSVGPWRLDVAAGFSVRKRSHQGGEQTAVPPDPTQDGVLHLHSTPQVEAWLRRKARLREFRTANNSHYGTSFGAVGREDPFGR